MRILITGGAGFVGSKLALSFKKKYADSCITCFDNLKRRGSELNLPVFKENKIEFVHGDIRVAADVESLGEFDIIIDGAAEPSVLAGIGGGLDYLVQTNLNGTINLLNLASRNRAKFVFLSTSRVYPIHYLEKINYSEGDTRFEVSDNQIISGFSRLGVSEGFPIDGSRSYYGSSKYASELFVEEFNAIADVPTVINRCGVLSGPGQMGKVDQGVVVLWMARHFWKRNLSYIGFGGTGKQVRDVLHIDDLFNLIDWQVNNFEKVNGGLYNVGGGRDISASLLEMTRLCEKISGNRIDIKSVAETRAADVPLYITDSEKIMQLSGWKPEKSIEDIFNEIYEWISENENFLSSILNG